MKIIHLLCLLFIAVIAKAASPVEALLERIDKGASGKFIIEQIKSPVDFSGTGSERKQSRHPWK